MADEIAELTALAERVVSSARERGVDVAEAIARSGSELSTKVRLGEPELTVTLHSEDGVEETVWLYAARDEGVPARASGREAVICGDLNIAHKPVDLKNWRSNQKNSGFLPEERAWLDHVFDELGFVDAFRVVNQEPEQYTWWSNRGQAWAKNVGWRLDYQVVTPGLRERVRAARIYKAKRFSDHAPLIMDYDLAP